jgi:hypothetical protein
MCSSDPPPPPPVSSPPSAADADSSELLVGSDPPSSVDVGELPSVVVGGASYSPPSFATAEDSDEYDVPDPPPPRAAVACAIAPFNLLVSALALAGVAAALAGVSSLSGSTLYNTPPHSTSAASERNAIEYPLRRGQPR